ncbi:MAG: tetratricopeptide repeat protein [Candidatus Rokubacteria bacterium]|nr:tetratricopeptide repeat protein [Candidatus Rokubacteria bacterium]
MTAVREALAGLPPLARWGLLGLGGLILALLVGAGVWTFLERREAAGRLAFADAANTYRQAMAEPGEAQVAAAAGVLTQFLKDYPRSAVAGQAWYFLGNLEYQRRAYDQALNAFEEATRRDGGTLGALSRLAAGYAWEAKGDAARALETYREALKDRGPTDFLYAELLLSTARTHEVLNQRDAAVSAYRRFLKDVPGSPRAGEVRGRLASLGAGA